MSIDPVAIAIEATARRLEAEKDFARAVRDNARTVAQAIDFFLSDEGRIWTARIHGYRQAEAIANHRVERLSH
jgi:hypothetical protein